MGRWRMRSACPTRRPRRRWGCNPSGRPFPTGLQPFDDAEGAVAELGEHRAGPVSLLDAYDLGLDLPGRAVFELDRCGEGRTGADPASIGLEGEPRSEAHTSELQSLMRFPFAVFCLKKTHILNPLPITHHI